VLLGRASDWNFSNSAEKSRASFKPLNGEACDVNEDHSVTAAFSNAGSCDTSHALSPPPPPPPQSSVLLFTDLIEGKGTGIFDILDEENKVPKPATEHFTDEVHKKNREHFRLSVSH